MMWRPQNIQFRRKKRSCCVKLGRNGQSLKAIKQSTHLHPRTSTVSSTHIFNQDSNDFLFFEESQKESGSSIMSTIIDCFEHTSRLSRRTEVKEAGIFAWYCFLISLVVPVCMSIFYCLYIKHRSHRRAQEHLDRELQNERDEALTRMESNVQVFSEAEKSRRTKSMRAAIRGHVTVREKRSLLFILK
jgi:hypothetical protein